MKRSYYKRFAKSRIPCSCCEPSPSRNKLTIRQWKKWEERMELREAMYQYEQEILE